MLSGDCFGVGFGRASVVEDDFYNAGGVKRKLQTVKRNAECGFTNSKFSIRNAKSAFRNLRSCLKKPRRGDNSIAWGNAPGSQSSLSAQALKGRHRVLRPFTASYQTMTCDPALSPGSDMTPLRGLQRLFKQLLRAICLSVWLVAAQRLSHATKSTRLTELEGACSFENSLSGEESGAIAGVIPAIGKYQGNDAQTGSACDETSHDRAAQPFGGDRAAN